MRQSAGEKMAHGADCGSLDIYGRLGGLLLSKYIHRCDIFYLLDAIVDGSLSRDSSFDMNSGC